MHKHDYNKKAQMSSGHGRIRSNIILQRPHTEESEGMKAAPLESLPFLLLHRKDTAREEFQKLQFQTGSSLKEHTLTKCQGVAKQIVWGMTQ